MAIKPSPTIAGKLRKLFNNNKQTIEPAIGDSIPGGSEGGGANVLTLYLGEKNGTLWAYKNQELTEEYSNYEEAKTAIMSATNIILNTTFSDNADYSIIYPINAYCNKTDDSENVSLGIKYGYDFDDVNLWRIQKHT